MKRMLAFFLVLLLTASLFAGCTKAVDNGSGTAGTTNTAAPADQTTPEADEPALPLADGATFSMWYQFPLMTTVITSYNDSEVFKELESRTGVHVDFIHPPMTDFGVSAFNLLMASQDYPDTFFTFPMVWTQGMDKYIEDEILVDLKDYVKDYAPHLTAFLDANPSLRRDSYTDTGRLPGFTQIQYQKVPGYTCGTAVRADIMDDLGLSTPVTYDDFHDMLAAMKASSGMYLDLAPDEPYLMAGYNVSGDFMYNDSGKIVYTRIQDGFRKYLSTMNQWYRDGLIDPDFMTNTTNDTVNLIASEKDCASNVLFATNLGRSMVDTGATANANLNLRPVPLPKETASTVVHAGKLDGYEYQYAYRSAYQVTTAAQDPVLITKWFDYMYTDEGILLTNYGFEGETFEYDENGNPSWLPIIYNNPDGKNISETQQMYLWHFPPFSDFDKETKTYIYEEQRIAGALWFDTDLSYALPTSYSFTADEGTQYAALFNDIDTYSNEMMLKFITGGADVTNDAEWNAYVAKVDSMNIAAVIDLLNAAYDRYYARG